MTDDGYNAADNSAKSYALAIETMRDKLEKLPPVNCAGVPVRLIGEPEANVLIYGVSKPDLQFVYIGSTTQGLRRRMSAHISDARKGSDLEFHKWLLANLDGLEVRVLEVVKESLRHVREQHWARLHSSTILNMTDGGPGMSGRRFAGTPHAQRIGAKLRSGKVCNCLECGTAFWRKRTEVSKGNDKFCSRECYAQSQVGKHKAVPRLCTEKGIAAAAKKKKERTHCWRGHEFTPANLYINKRGARVCKACHAIHKSTYKSKAVPHVEA